MNRRWNALIGDGRCCKLAGSWDILYRWRTSSSVADVGSAVSKDEKAQKKHMADISTSCSEPRVIDRLALLGAKKQLLKMLKQFVTISELGLESGSARIVLRKPRVDKLTVLSNDVRNIHEMQRKSNAVSWRSGVVAYLSGLLRPRIPIHTLRTRGCLINRRKTTDKGV